MDEDIKEEGSLGLGMLGEEDSYGLGPADRVLTDEEVENWRRILDTYYTTFEIKNHGKCLLEPFVIKACMKI